MNAVSAPDAGTDAVRIVKIKYWIRHGPNVQQHSLTPNPSTTLHIPASTMDTVKVWVKAEYTGPAGTLGMVDIFDGTVTACQPIHANKKSTVETDGIYQTAAGTRSIVVEVFGNGGLLHQTIHIDFM